MHFSIDLLVQSKEQIISLTRFIAFICCVLLSSSALLGSDQLLLSRQPSDVWDVRENVQRCETHAVCHIHTVERGLGSTSNRAGECDFLQKEVKVIKFWARFDRG